MKVDEVCSVMKHRW